jgi:hypothetical protein
MLAQVEEAEAAKCPLNRPYRVTQRLPAARGEPQYRIRCILTEREFAASDGELRAIA